MAEKEKVVLAYSGGLDTSVIVKWLQVEKNMDVIAICGNVGQDEKDLSWIKQKALDMGFDGLIIESHCQPDAALSDARQQVTPAQLKSILDALVVREPNGTTESLDMLRRQIDKIDSELLDVLNRRMEVSREIGRYKKEHRMLAVQPARYGDIMDTRIQAGETMGLDPEFMRVILSAIHEESVRQQIEILNAPSS